MRTAANVSSYWHQTAASRALATRRVALLLILLLAFALRLYRLDSQSLRGDEAATVFYSALPLTELWELSRVTDPHPPFYYLLLHPWQWLVGEAAWAMRLAGVMASVLAVAALYGLARLTLRSAAPALLAAALLAVNPFQVWLAQDIRSYPFFTLVGLLSSAALWGAINGSAPDNRQTAEADGVEPKSPPIPAGPSRSLPYGSRAGPWLIYVLVTVAGLYIHYYTVFLIAFQGLFVLVNLKKYWSKKWPWLASQVAIGLLIGPGLGLAYNFIGQAAGGIETIPTAQIVQRASTALLSGVTLGQSWGLWLSLLIAPIWLAGLVSLWRRDVTVGSFWTLFFAGPVLGVLALSIGRPFFKERFLIQAQPAFELLLAVGFLTLSGVKWGSRRVNAATLQTADEALQTANRAPPRSRQADQAGRTPGTIWQASATTFYAGRLAGLLLAALLLSANISALKNYYADPAYAKSPPWRLYNDYVSSEARPGDVMLTNFPEAAVSYYSPNELPFYVTPAERDRPVDFRIEETRAIANAYDRIWFLPLLRQGFDEQGDVLNWLDRHGDRVNQIFFPIYNLNLYLSPPTIDRMIIDQPVTFAHGLHLRGYQIFDTGGRSRIQERGPESLFTTEPGDEFTLSLYWLAGGPTARPYTVFTHLINAGGVNLAGRDNQPVWNSYPTIHWQPGEKITDKYSLTVPPDSPPGDLRLRLGWYQSDTLERVPVLDEAGQPGADHVTLDVIVRVE